MIFRWLQEDEQMNAECWMTRDVLLSEGSQTHDLFEVVGTNNQLGSAGEVDGAFNQGQARDKGYGVKTSQMISKNPSVLFRTMHDILDPAVTQIVTVLRPLKVS